MIDNSDAARQLAEITGHAFADDPFNSWVFGTRMAMETVFRAEARHIYLPRGRTEIIDNKAAMMWLQPGTSKDLSLFAGMTLLGRLLRHGGTRTVRRALQAARALRDAFPDEPVTYLYTIAVRPTAQGEGLGGHLMRRFVADCHAAGSAGWLESSNPGNHGFYRSFGFETRDVITIAPGAPPMELMCRPATPSGSPV